MPKIKKYFVTGIGTDIGKTIASAILTEALSADYWKPVQCGDLSHTDAQKVKALISNPVSKFHPERYRLSNPLSPHAAAAIDGEKIEISDFHLPVTANHLIVEGAGGLMVPLNNHVLVADLIALLQIPAIIVSRNYLGSINHTLLTCEVLQKRNIPVAGIIFNDAGTYSSESLIAEYTGIPVLGYIQHEPVWNKEIIKKYADVFAAQLN